MGKLARLLHPLPPIIFACLAFAFTVVTITSRDWARQYHFSTSESIEWNKPLYSLYRSPFQICELKDENSTSYNLHCYVYDAYGFGKTSCESLFATQSDEAAQTGDLRLCQQIHRAGNLAITATTFISLGFLCTLLMTILAYTYSPSKAAAEIAEAEANNHESKDGVVAASTHHRRHHKYPKYPSYVNLVLITAFAIGATATLLSQFYGILAFTESAPDNALFAGGKAQPFSLDDNKHAPWIEGRVLSAYATCAWVFAAFAAGAAGAAWRLPRIEKGI